MILFKCKLWLITINKKNGNALVGRVGLNTRLKFLGLTTQNELLIKPLGPVLTNKQNVKMQIVLDDRFPQKKGVGVSLTLWALTAFSDSAFKPSSLFPCIIHQTHHAFSLAAVPCGQSPSSRSLAAQRPPNQRACCCEFPFCFLFLLFDRPVVLLMLFSCLKLKLTMNLSL